MMSPVHRKQSVSAVFCPFFYHLPVLGVIDRLRQEYLQLRGGYHGRPIVDDNDIYIYIHLYSPFLVDN